MPPRKPRKTAQERPHHSTIGTPAQEDEADILQEVGAERDEETGDLLVDEARVTAVGAVDAASVRENRRMQDFVDKKKGHEKGITFNTDDVLQKYDVIIASGWPANTLAITAKRLTGSPVTRVITSRPRSGTELYEALMVIHGQHEEAKYSIRIVDDNTKTYRGNGDITLPDTRPQQGQQPMTHPYYPGYAPPQPYGAPPYGAQVPPGYQPPPPPQQAAPTAQPSQASQPPPQQPPPVVVQAPPGPDMNSMIGSMRQMFEMFQTMQQQANPAQPAAPQFQMPPPQMPMPPPMPAPGADMATMMAWMQQMFEMVRSMQPPAPQPQTGPVSRQSRQEAPTHANPYAGMMGMPPMQLPPGMVWTPIGAVPVERLLEAMGGDSTRGRDREYRGPDRSAHRPPPYEGRQPPYEGRPPPYEGRPSPYEGRQPPPHYDPQGRQPSYGPYDRGAAPAREKSPVEQLQESLRFVQTAVTAVQDMNSMLPGVMGGHQTAEAFAPEEDESPIRVVDIGPGKAVINKSDGSLRKWETGLANMDRIFKFIGEQHEQIQKAQLQQQQERRRALPPGYVEVDENYRPPPGFVAVPVATQQPQYAPPPPQQQPQYAPPQPQDPLQPPPSYVPPPIHQAPPEPPPQHASWDMPTIPGYNDEAS